METDSLLRHNKPGKLAFEPDLYLYRFCNRAFVRHNKPGKRAFVPDLYLYRFYKRAFVPDFYLYGSYKWAFVPDLCLVATGFVSWHLYQMEIDSLLSQNKPGKRAFIPDLYLVTKVL